MRFTLGPVKHRFVYLSYPDERKVHRRAREFRYALQATVHSGGHTLATAGAPLAPKNLNKKLEYCTFWLS